MKDLIELLETKMELDQLIEQEIDNLTVKEFVELHEQGILHEGKLSGLSKLVGKLTKAKPTTLAKVAKSHSTGLAKANLSGTRFAGNKVIEKGERALGMNANKFKEIKSELKALHPKEREAKLRATINRNFEKNATKHNKDAVLNSDFDKFDANAKVLDSSVKSLNTNNKTLSSKIDTLFANQLKRQYPDVASAKKYTDHKF